MSRKDDQEQKSRITIADIVKEASDIIDALVSYKLNDNTFKYPYANLELENGQVVIIE